jgi:hypothetical protein
METEDWLRGILYLLGKDHPGKLLAFVREPYRNSYVRSAVMNAIGQVGIRNESRREEVLNYYYDLYEEILHPDLPAGLLDTTFISYSVGELIELKDGERTISLLKKMFARELVDPSIQGDLYEVENQVQNKKAVHSLFNIPSDIEDYFSGDYRMRSRTSPINREDYDYTAFFSPIDKLLNRLRSKQALVPSSTTKVHPSLASYSPATKGEKIGRNEPCPCGSGKKYKQCCLKK